MVLLQQLLAVLYRCCGPRPSVPLDIDNLDLVEHAAAPVLGHNGQVGGVLLANALDGVFHNALKRNKMKGIKTKRKRKYE